MKNMLLVAWMQVNRIFNDEERKLVRQVWFYRDEREKELKEENKVLKEELKRAQKQNKAKCDCTKI